VLPTTPQHLVLYCIADDIDLLEEDKDELQENLKRLNEAREASGLKINIQKTMTIVFGQENIIEALMINSRVDGRHQRMVLDRRANTQRHRTGLFGVETSCHGDIGHQRAQAHGMKKKKNEIVSCHYNRTPVLNTCL